MSDFNITAAQHQQDDDGNNFQITATIDGIERIVPINTANRHYQAILDWVAEGNSIADAD